MREGWRAVRTYVRVMLSAFVCHVARVCCVHGGQCVSSRASGGTARWLPGSSLMMRSPIQPSVVLLLKFIIYL